MINGISGLKDHYAVLGIEMLLNGIKSLLSLAGFLTYTCKYAEALRLNVDLTLFTLLASYLISV